MKVLNTFMFIVTMSLLTIIGIGAYCHNTQTPVNGIQRGVLNACMISFIYSFWKLASFRAD